MQILWIILLTAFITAVTVSTLNAVCFFIGAKIRQTVDRGEPVRMPSVNPVETYRQHRAKKEAEMEQNRIDIILQNIERYDGTAEGQQEVPGR